MQPVKKGFRRLYIGRLLFTSAFVLIVLFFHTVDVWNKHFSSPGPAYLISNILRILFLFYFAWAVYFLGYPYLKLILKRNKCENLNSIDNYILSSFIGSSIIILFILIIGFLNILYPLLLMAILSIIIFISYSHLHDTYILLKLKYSSIYDDNPLLKNKWYLYISFTLVIIILVQTFYFLITRGIFPDLITNDTAGHYVPFMNYIARTHGLWMNKFFLHFFYTKGAGPHFLATLLTDVQSIQTVSFYFFMLSCLVMFSITRILCQDELLLPLLTVTACLSSGMFLSYDGLAATEFQKPHIMVWSFIIINIYLCMLNIISQGSKFKILSNVQIVVSSTAIIMSPPSASVLLPLLFFQICWMLFFKKREQARYSIYVFIAASCSFLLMLSFNYLVSGLPEFTPLTFFYKFKNGSTLEKWLSPYVIDLFIQMNELRGEGAGGFGLGGGRPFWRAVGSNAQSVLLEAYMMPWPVLLALAAAGLFWAIRKKRINADKVKVLLPPCFILAVVFVLLTVTRQISIYRYMGFVTFFKAALYVFAVYSALKALFFWKNPRFAGMAAALILLIPGLSTFCRVALANNAAGLDKGLRHFTGNLCYAEIYDKKWGAVKLGLDFLQALPDGGKIYSLLFFPGLYVIPGGAFEEPLMNSFNGPGVFEAAMFGPPDEAARVLKEKGVSCFLVLTQGNLVPMAYTPLFEPSSIRRHFTVCAEDSNGVLFLLGWRNSGDPPVSEDFIKKFSALTASSSRSPNALAYRAIKESWDARDRAEGRHAPKS